MAELTMGVLARSAKENEKRLPIHPRHFDRIDPDLRARMWLEPGYGNHYGVSDDQLAPLIAGFAPHAALVDRCDILPSFLLPPAALGHGAVNHRRLFVQAAIERIEFERKK